VTNPPDLKLVSNGLKLGHDRPAYDNEGRCPSNSICPSEHDICKQFTRPPFAPAIKQNTKL